MIEFLIYFFGCMGITYTITDTKIATNLRDKFRSVLNGLLDCFFCTSFWVFFISGLFIHGSLYVMIFGSFAFTFIAWVIYLIITFLSNKADV